MSTYISNSNTANVKIIRKKGDTFYFGAQISMYADDCETLLPVNLDLYDFAKMEVKAHEYSDPLLTFTSTGTTYTIDISNKENGQIFINGPQIELPVNHYLFDLEMTNSETTETIMSGKFIIESEVTI